MSTAILYPSSDSPHCIFLLSALGSAILHAALLAGLMYLPDHPVIQESSPTIQVKLVPAPQDVSPASQPLPKSLASARPDLPQRPLPSPPPEPMQSPAAPPLQASLTPAPSQPMVPPLSLSKTQPTLKDTRTEQAIKNRQMMKMAVPQRPDQSPSASPAIPRREIVPARIPFELKSTPSVQHTLPPPTSPTALPALKASTPNSVGSSISKPMIVSSSKPLYPRVARESGWEGTVIIRTLITPDGVPSHVEVRKSCGHETLDLSAQEAIKSWRFQPAKDGNIPIAKWVDIPIKFDLNS